MSKPQWFVEHPWAAIRRGLTVPAAVSHDPQGDDDA